MRNLHVVSHEDGWAVKREGQARPTSVHDTQREAIEAARATDEPASLLIHATDGRIRERSTYGHSELTEKALFDDPLALLNAEPEDRRAFFEQRLADPEDVQQALDLAEAFRAVFDALADDFDYQRLNDLAGDLREAWEAVAPLHKPTLIFNVVATKSKRELVELLRKLKDGDVPEDCQLNFRDATVPLHDESPPWSAGMLGNGDGIVWRKLMDLLKAVEKPEDVGYCEYCGDILTRPPKSRGKRFCSDSCRVMAHRQRT